MACVEGIEQGPRFDSPDFSEDDSVGSEPECVFQQVVKRNVRFEGICLRSCRNYIWFPNMKFGGILDDDNPLVVGNEVCENPQKSRLPGPRSAAN